MEEKFIKVGEAAKLLQCGRQSLIQIADKGFVPFHIVGYYRDGRIKRRYLKSEIEIYKNKVIEKSTFKKGGK